VKGYIRRTGDERRTFAILAQQCHHSGTQELFTKFGTEPKLGLSSFRGRAVSRASHDSKTESGALSFACSCQRSLQVAVCRGNANGSSGRSASERKIRTRLPCRQPRSMRLAVGVRSADPVFLTVIVHFQVVGHLFTALAITQHGHV
jgi:hypothetical protein